MKGALTVGVLRARLDRLPDELPVMAEVTTVAMDLQQAAQRFRDGKISGQELSAAILACGSAWVIGTERFDPDQASAGDGVLLLTE